MNKTTYYAVREPFIPDRIPFVRKVIKYENYREPRMISSIEQIAYGYIVYQNPIHKNACDFYGYVKEPSLDELRIRMQRKAEDVVREQESLEKASKQKTLRELRHEAGLTLKGASAFLGVPPSTWKAWEMGKRHCPSYVMEYLTRELTDIGRSLFVELFQSRTTDDKVYRELRAYEIDKRGSMRLLFAYPTTKQNSSIPLEAFIRIAEFQAGGYTIKFGSMDKVVR